MNAWNWVKTGCVFQFLKALKEYEFRLEIIYICRFLFAHSNTLRVTKNTHYISCYFQAYNISTYKSHEKGKAHIDYCSVIIFKHCSITGFEHLELLDIVIKHFFQIITIVFLDVWTLSLVNFRLLKWTVASRKHVSKHVNLNPCCYKEFLCTEEIPQTPPTSLFGSAVSPLSWKLCNYPTIVITYALGM